MYKFVKGSLKHRCMHKKVFIDKDIYHANGNVFHLIVSKMRSQDVSAANFPCTGIIPMTNRTYIIHCMQTFNLVDKCVVKQKTLLLSWNYYDTIV